MQPMQIISDALCTYLPTYLPTSQFWWKLKLDREVKEIKFMAKQLCYKQCDQIARHFANWEKFWNSLANVWLVILYWAIFYPTLNYFYFVRQIFHCCKWPKIWTNNKGSLLAGNSKCVFHSAWSWRLSSLLAFSTFSFSTLFDSFN